MAKKNIDKVQICDAAECAISRRGSIDPKQPGDRRAVAQFVELIVSTTKQERRDFELGLVMNIHSGCYKSRDIRDKKTDVLATLAKFSDSVEVGSLYAGVEYVYIRTWRAVFAFYQEEVERLRSAA